MSRLLSAFLVALLPAVLSCGGDSDPVAPIDGAPMELTINSINPSDITAGIIDREVSISSAADGLWTSYVRLVTDLCGREPVGFTIRSIGVTLDFEESVNVNALDDVLDGAVTIYLTSGDVTVDIGTGLLSGLGPVGLQDVSTQQTLAAIHDRMLASDFHVGLRGETSRTDSDDFSMEVGISFLTRAFCQ